MVAGLADFYPALPVFFVISLVLLVLPVWGFIRGRNVPVLFYIAWLFLGNAIYFVDMLVWHGSVINFAPVYCDIISSLVVMLPLGLSCSLLCINILVWRISQSNTLIVTPTKRRIVVDCLICVGVPLFFAALHVVVQDKRYTIVEDVGCIPSTDQALLSLFLYYLPPSIICCGITSVFCVRAMINFYRTRHRANPLLPDYAGNAMSSNRWLRLILLCATSFLVIAAFLVSMVIQNLQIGFYSAFTMTNGTWDFQNVEVISRVELDIIPHRKTRVLLQLLPLPILAFHFFLFFGIGEEAMRNYRGSVFALRGMFRKVAPIGSQQKEETRTSKTEKSQGINFYSKDPSPSPRQIPTALPPVLITPAFSFRRDFLLVEDHQNSPMLRPSSVYIVPSPSIDSSNSSVSLSAGHFPHPPPHSFHEHPYTLYTRHEEKPKPATGDTIHPVQRVINPTIDSRLNFNVDIETGLRPDTGTTRSRLSMYSDFKEQSRSGTEVYASLHLPPEAKPYSPNWSSFASIDLERCIAQIIASGR